jgi:hypothetical protein
MLTSRLLGAIGIVAVAAGISGALSAQTPTRPSNGPRLVALPDDPCDLLTREQVALATGLEITNVQRQPNILQTTQPGPRCAYQTRSEFSDVTIVIPVAEDRTAEHYRQWRDEYFATYPGAGRVISGVGEESWLGGGSRLYVLTPQHENFMLQTQRESPGSADILIALARAVLARLQ